MKAELRDVLCDILDYLGEKTLDVIEKINILDHIIIFTLYFIGRRTEKSK